MDKDTIKLQLLAVPTFLLLGLGINSLYSNASSKIHPFLENQSIGTALLLLGGAGAVFSLYKGFLIFKKRWLK